MIFSFVYELCQIFLTYVVLPHENYLKNVFYVRVGCACFQLVILLVALVSNDMMRKNINGDYPNKIPAGVPAYTDNIVLNFSEWFAVTTIVLFLSTFYVEFKNIKLSLNVVIEQGEDEVTQEEEVKKLLKWLLQM